MQSKYRKICPYCYSDLTSHIYTNFINYKWIIKCPFCNKKMCQDSYGNYYKYAYLKFALIVGGILLVSAVLFFLFFK